MLLRRLARLVLVAFIAGPVLNVPCLLSCVKAGVLTSAETCHHSGDRSDAVSSEQGCAEPAVALSPFLKANELLQLPVVVPVFHTDHRSAAPVYDQASVAEPGTGPPGFPSPLVPLRI
jgi:hypothetical protein